LTAASTPDIQANATDSDNATGLFTTFDVHVNNVDPTATLSNNGPINEGGSATISCSNQLDASPTDTTAGFHYAFSCTNASLAGATYAGSGTSSTVDCDFDDPGTQTVRARIIDKDNGFTEYTTVVTVNNVAPDDIAVSLLTGAIDEGQLAGLRGTFTDPGTLDTHTVTIDWGDGSTDTVLTLTLGARSFGASHRYVDDDPTGTPNDDYTITVTVSDDDSGSDSTTTDITVNNVAPVLSGVATAGQIDENGTATLIGSITDPGTDDTFALTVNWGEGAPTVTLLPAGSTAFSVTHQYLDDNPTATPFDIYSISVSISDDDGGSDVDSASQRVDNVSPTFDPPTIDPPLTQVVDEGDAANLAWTFTDPGTQDTFTLTVDWGEGDAPSVYPLPMGSTSFSVFHTYVDDNPTGTDHDTYNVSWSLVDDDTGGAGASGSLIVQNQAPTMILSGPDDVDEATTQTYEFTTTDPGIEDTFTLEEVDCGANGENLTWIDAFDPDDGSGKFSCDFPDDNPTGTPVGNSTVHVMIADDDGGESIFDINVLIRNLDPDADIGGNRTVNEGDLVAFAATVTDPSSEDTFPGTLYGISCSSGQSTSSRSASTTWGATLRPTTWSS
jgi:hypothetical protein